MKKTADDFIKEHTHINYCEAIIHPDGLIEYAAPSHVEALIRITGEPREVIYNKMPITESPIHWLIDYTGCISVWTNGYIVPRQKCPTVQLLALTKLFNTRLVKAYTFR